MQNLCSTLDQGLLSLGESALATSWLRKGLTLGADLGEPSRAPLQGFASNLRGASVPAGSAVFFTENVCHAGPVWEKTNIDIDAMVAEGYVFKSRTWHSPIWPNPWVKKQENSAGSGINQMD